MIDGLACIFTVLASICLTMYVARHGMRKAIRAELESMLIDAPDCQSDFGWNQAVNALLEQLITREWVKPMRKKGTI